MIIAWTAAILIQRWLQAMLTCCKETAMWSWKVYTMTRSMLLTLLIF